MAESGTYDLATIQRRQKIAEQMLAESSKPQRIDHWAQGLAHLGNVGADVLALNRLDKQEKGAQQATLGAYRGMLGGADTPGAAAPPAPVGAPDAPATPPGGISDRIISAESGGDPNAKNPNSSATGAGQFINSTWLDTIKKARPDLAAGKDDATLLAMRSDPALSKEMTDAYATQNRSALANAGLPTTPGATYLAHFAGPGGAKSVLSADPKTRVAELLSPGAMKANAFLAPMTAGDLRGWADRKMGGSPAAPVAPPPNVMGPAGPAAPDAEGVYPSDAVMMPPGQPPAPSGPAAVAQAMAPQPQAAAAPPAAPPTDARSKIVAMLNDKNPAVQRVGMQLAQQYVQKNMLGTDRTDDIKEYDFATKQGFKGTLEEWLQRKRGGAGEYGLQPIWGVGPDGKPAVLQLGKSGKSIQAGIPDGFSIAKDPVKVEGPTGTVLLDPQTRQQIGFIPKDVAGAAKAKEIGEAEGQATANLPTVITTAENTLKTIEQLKNHPGKKNWGSFGWGAMLPDAPGGSTRGFGALVDQVKGQNFMTAFQSLKGAGAITEQEGAKAEKAQARLDRAQNEKDFDAALDDLISVVKTGMQNARVKAGGAKTPAAPAAAPPAPDPLGIR